MSTTLNIEEFSRYLAEHLQLAATTLTSCGPLIPSLGLDELSWADLVNTVEFLNPYFHLPDQLDVSQVTLADLYYYHQTMDAGHMRPAKSEAL